MALSLDKSKLVVEHNDKCLFEVFNVIDGKIRPETGQDNHGHLPLIRRWHGIPVWLKAVILWIYSKDQSWSYFLFWCRNRASDCQEMTSTIIDSEYATLFSENHSLAAMANVEDEKKLAFSNSTQA
ncbi:hypothetical protein JOM56_009853 [Amanita muscaria]